MKKYLTIILLIAGFLACEKEEGFRIRTFPGVTGAGNEAIWVVYSHVVSDIPYITGVMTSQTPPSTITAFEATLVSARQREVSPYSMKFLSSGEIATIGKDAQNQNAWIKQTSLKWEFADGIMNISKNVNGNWINVIAGYEDQSNLLLRFKKSYFGDTSAEKDKAVLEVLYNMFK